MKEEKQQFNSRIGFLLTSIGFAVGLGNIWRYSFTAFDNGGGAFLVPYFVALLSAGIPILILEYFIGSKFRGSPPLAFSRLSKKWEFVGWIAVVVTAMIVYYYIVILVWVLEYVWFAITGAWNHANGPGYFFDNVYLGNTGSPWILGEIQWRIAAITGVIWLLTYFIMSRDIAKSLEPISKVLVPGFIVALIILIGYTVTLPGAALGLNALFTPNWEYIADPMVWSAAYGQVFFSVGVGWGAMILFASYMPKNAELVNSSITVVLSDALIAMMGATTVFAILGYMAATQGVPVSDVALGGVGLVFRVLPVGFISMGGFGAILGTFFFFALFIVGWSSFIGMLDLMSTSIAQKLNITRKKAYVWVCATGFILSVPYTSGAGLSLLGIVSFLSEPALMIVAFFASVLCFYVLKNMPEVKAHLNRYGHVHVGKWFDILIGVFPVLMVVIIGGMLHGFITGPTPVNTMITFHGGITAAIVIAVIILCKMKWRIDIEDYEKD